MLTTTIVRLKKIIHFIPTNNLYRMNVHSEYLHFNNSQDLGLKVSLSKQFQA